MTDLDNAIAALRAGGMIVLFDGDEREGEADLVVHARFATPETIRTLRQDAGGLICLALDGKIADDWGLPFYSEMLVASKLPVAAMECKKTAYGDKPAFSIQVNHRDVFTGITDNDRSLTIRGVERLAGMGLGREDARAAFHSEFYAPGHVFLLIGRGIKNRRGHTELSLELARRAGLDGAMVLCEMLGEGKALPKAEAKAYAKERGLMFIEGRELI
ncbi:3,4-dihydroxy-2-butanone-4-phosphate synthase [Candidatus Micrarchaeota archaeon]|nr:3,4-dihydroxy-2-butanone-4-phosphate synthase [Candidatus Micrarchaeota archaeon]